MRAGDRLGQQREDACGSRVRPGICRAAVPMAMARPEIQISRKQISLRPSAESLKKLAEAMTSVISPVRTNNT